MALPFKLEKKTEPCKPLGIYVHIPFCRSKCQYCDFYSIGGSRERGLMDDYLQALSRHMKEAGALSGSYLVDTVYFGGGTPSFFGYDGLIRILNDVRRRFNIAPEAEITFEANPDSVSDELLQKLKSEGFNRVSIGVQSDNDELLAKLGRPHNYAQTVQAVARARQAGFDNLSLDLIYGLPGQTLQQWEQTLEHVLELEPEHVSCYGLTVEPNTPLWEYKDCCNLPDDDAQAEMYLAMVELLEKRGYVQYEISNFSKPGFASKHNLKYWTGGEYLGFGPAAASDFAGKRFTAIADIHTYIDGILHEGIILSECQSIAPRERAGEYVMLRLRTTQGLDPEEYIRQYLLPFRPLERLLEQYSEHGLCRQDEGRWVLTPRGFQLSNQIIAHLLEAQEKSPSLAKRG